MSKISKGIIRAKSGFRIADVDSNTMLNDSKYKWFHTNPKNFHRIAQKNDRTTCISRASGMHVSTFTRRGKRAKVMNVIVLPRIML